MKDRIIFDAKVSSKRILLIPTETIAGTPYNPADRTKESSRLRKLAESVRVYGLIQPLIITSSRDLVDGNRRLAAAKLAGLEVVECIVLPEGVNQHEIFRDVNSTAEKIQRRGWLEACRHGFKNPPKDVFAEYQELFALIGSYGIDLLIEKRLGLSALTLCKQIRSIGTAMRLDEMVIRVAKGRLTNKINTIYRSNIDRSEKVAQISALLESVL